VVAPQLEMFGYGSKAEVLRDSIAYWNPNKTQFWIDEEIPLIIGKREGYVLTDIDGHSVFDVHLNGGTFNLGHRNPEVIASLVNMFMQSGTMYLIISALGVLIFSGLIAYDTQRLKMTYYQLGGNQEAMGVATGFGALSLFINFINLFQFLLAFMGGRR